MMIARPLLAAFALTVALSTGSVAQAQSADPDAPALEAEHAEPATPSLTPSTDQAPEASPAQPTTPAQPGTLPPRATDAALSEPTPGRSLAAGDHAPVPATDEAPTRPRFPAFGVAVAGGEELSWIDGQFAQGPTAHLRLIATADTYPLLAVGVGYRYSHLFIEGGGEADTHEPTLMLATMFPMNLLMETPPELPEAAGVGVYVAIKPAAVLRMGGATSVGWGIDAGLGIPIPPLFSLDLMYGFSSYGDPNTGRSIQRHTFTISLQVPIGLTS